MAEMAPTLEIDLEDPSEIPYLEPVNDFTDRPPKMTDEDTVFHLRRGPYLARLNASRRKLAIAQKLVDGYAETDMFAVGYISSLAEEVASRESALAHFEIGDGHGDESVAADNVVSIDDARLKHADMRPSVDTAPGRITALVDSRARQVDFLKRKATALCAQVDPDLFFPEKGGTSKPAKKLCEQSCDMTQECLSHALENRERFGIWGGKSERERRKLIRTMGDA